MSRKVIQLTVGVMAVMVTTVIVWMAMAEPEQRIITLKREIELLEQADDLKTRLTTSAIDYLENAAAGFQLARPLRIQERLFRDDLEWMSRGFNKKQMDLMVFIVVALSLERVDPEIAALKERNDLWARKHTKRIRVYKYQAFILLDEISGRLKELLPSEFGFYF